MFEGLFIASIIATCYQGIKEASQPTIPAENWANKELYHKDMMNGVPIDQLMNNVQNGRYKITEKYPEPHRDPISGKIIIENNLLYDNDLKKYGAYQTMKWVNQGKYNLTQEELKREHDRLQNEFEKNVELYRACRKKYKY